MANMTPQDFGVKCGRLLYIKDTFPVADHLAAAIGTPSEVAVDSYFICR